MRVAQLQQLRQLRIGTRLAIGFGLLLFMLLVQVASVSFVSHRNSVRIEGDLALANQRAQHATALRTALLQAGVAMRNIGLQTDLSAMQGEEDRFNAAQKRYAQARQALLASGLPEQERALVTQLDQWQGQMAAPMKEAVDDARAFNNEGAAKVIAVTIDPLMQQSMQQMDRLVALQESMAAAALGAVTSDSRSLVAVSLAIGLVSLLLGGASAWLITRGIVGPLKEAVLVARRVAAGELAASRRPPGRDEISQLQIALADMNDSLVRMVGEVRAATGAIHVSADEIAVGNADLSARTERQAASLEESAASMDALTSAVRLNAEHSGQANVLVQASAQQAANGGQIASEVVATMAAIRDSSRRVVDIVSVIDGIAFQTNILALNAAVEAARAGEQGRGFAVVASEVRSLAARSATAAREVRALIDDSVSKVDAGSTLVAQSGAAMDDIVRSVQHVRHIMADITEAGAAQSRGIAEVSQAVTMMDDMTQQNAALVEQAAASAESMRAQARRLTQVVAVFRLGGDAVPVLPVVPLTPPLAVARPQAIEQRSSLTHRSMTR